MVAEFWVHLGFRGPIFQLLSELRSEAVGCLLSGGVFLLLRVSKGAELKRKAGIGKPHGSSGMEEGEGGHFGLGIMRETYLPLSQERCL